MSKKVAIDPGHGAHDPGAVGGSRLEKNDNLLYATRLAAVFRSRGIEVVMTRTGDTYPTYDQRTAIERNNKCDLAICCHRNAATTATATGLELWLHSQAPQSYVNWAKSMVAKIKAVGMNIRAGQYGEGVYKGMPGAPSSNFYWNNGTNSPSVLVELGFITNSADNAVFDAKVDALVTAIADASCDFLGVSYGEPEAPQGPDYKALYEQSQAAKDALQAKYDGLKADMNAIKKIAQKEG